MGEFSDVPPRFSISHLWPTKERDILFQTSFISIQSCEQFIARILKVVKIMIKHGDPTNHRLLLINRRLNQAMRVHHGIVSVSEHNPHVIYYTTKSMDENKYRCHGQYQSSFELRVHILRSNIHQIIVNLNHSNRNGKNDSCIIINDQILRNESLVPRRDRIFPKSSKSRDQ